MVISTYKDQSEDQFNYLLLVISTWPRWRSLRAARGALWCPPGRGRHFRGRISLHSAPWQGKSVTFVFNWLVVWKMTFIFPDIWHNHPNWLICFRGVETTNQSRYDLTQILMTITLSVSGWTPQTATLDLDTNDELSRRSNQSTPLENNNQGIWCI